MDKPVSLRLDARMKRALEELAKREFTSVASLLKKGADTAVAERELMVFRTLDEAKEWMEI